MFITFEGIDGSGKSTLIREVTPQIEKIYQKEVLVTREPGGTDYAEAMRKTVLKDQFDLSSLTQALGIAAGRSDHVDKVIKPALDQGKIVLCDRFFDSSLAYQGFAGGVGIEKLYQLNLLATKNLEPNLTFFLDIDPDEAWTRIKTPDQIEKNGLEFQKKVQQGYLELLQLFPQRFVYLKSNDIEEKVQLVLEHIQKHYDD